MRLKIRAIKELKNNKAGVKDELPAQHLKHGSELHHEIIYHILLRIREEEELPASIGPLSKKKRTITEEYRSSIRRT